MAKKKTSSKAKGNGQALVIVESPAKAKTIGKYLGKGFKVEASIGHIRDLPQGAKQVPAKYKGESWANLGVNVDDDFKPIYVIPPEKKKQIKLLKDQLKESDALYLATDEDREGEAFLSEVEEPSDVQLLDFYEKHQNQFSGVMVNRWGKQFPSPFPGFRQQRKVKLLFLLGDVSAWTEKMLDEVTDEAIADYYERNKRTQFVKFDPIFDEPEDQASTEDDSEEEDEESDETQGDSSEPAAESSDSDSETAAETEESGADEDEQETAEPAADDTGSAISRSPFHLTAFQDTTPQDNQAEENETSSEAEAAETDQQNGESTEETVKEESDSDSSSADSQADDQAEDDASRYEPLEKVSDQIRRVLATDLAVKKLAEVTEGAYSELTSVYNRYGGQVVAAEAEEKDPPPVPDALADLSGMAEEKGLFLEETVELTVQQLSETAVGKADDFQTRSVPIWQLAFTTLKLREPALAVDLDGYRYLVLKVADVPAQTPSFEDAREEVAEAWKLSEAKRLALEKGQEIANGAQEEDSSLVAAVGEQDYEIVSTDFFSRFSFGSVAAEMGRGPRLSDVPPLEHIGDDFLKRVFTLEDEEVVALANFDGSQVYVLSIEQKERTQDELRLAFLEEVNSSKAMQVMSAMRNQRMQNTLISQIFRRVQLDTRRLQQALQSSAQ